jgi:hypothetical protein
MEHVLSNDPCSVAFVKLAKGLDAVGRGKILTDDGRASVLIGMVSAAAIAHGFDKLAGDVDVYAEMIRHARGLHADKKDAPQAYAAAMTYWRDISYMSREAAGLKKPEAVRFDKYTAEKDTPGAKMDVGSRQVANAPIGARLSALMFASSVLVAFDKAAINWKAVSEGKGGSLVVDEDTIKRLFPERGEAIEAWQLNHFPIATYGPFRFTTLSEKGNEIMRNEGTKKKPPQRDSKIIALRDTLDTVATTIVEADAKSYDAPVDDNKALAALTGLANALNDGSLKHFRFTTDQFNRMMAIVDEAIADARAAEAKVIVAKSA